jgi:hypothetical protein
LIVDGRVLCFDDAEEDGREAGQREVDQRKAKIAKFAGFRLQILVKMKTLPALLAKTSKMAVGNFGQQKRRPAGRRGWSLRLW